jgi:hypothetical protein
MENKEITLKFPTIIELVDFQAKVVSEDIMVSRSQLTIVGEFSEAETKLAVENYNASILDNSADKQFS